MALSPGSQIAGYRVLSQLGQGGMGAVYLVDNPSLERREALKVISIAGAGDPSFQQRFTNEARTAAKLNHPSIITVHQYGIDNGAPWFSMSYIEGRDLSAERLRPAEVAQVVGQVADALDYAHRHRVIHRDIKPANIIVTREPGGVEHGGIEHGGGAIERTVVLDFGIAKLANTAGLTGTQGFIGTLAYSAPEVIDGGEATPAADQYSLAATAYALLTGQPPLVGSTPSAVVMAHVRGAITPVSQLRPDLAATDHVFARAFARNPADRFPNCRAFAAALGSALTAQTQPFTPPPPQTPPPPTPHHDRISTPRPIPGAPTPPPPARRRTGLIVASVAAVIVLLVAAGVGVFFWNKSRSGSDETSTTVAAQKLIATDGGASCAAQGGTLRCWGNNNFGQLGDGTTTERPAPVSLSGMTEITDISIGAFRKSDNTWPATTCAVSASKAFCWGDNAFGQVGDGQTGTTVSTPTQVGSLSDVTAISTGWGTTCAISAGEAYCWGDNDRGQLGASTPRTSTSPVKVPGLTGVRAIATGFGTTCAIADTGLHCWGDNRTGQVGNGSTSTEPVAPTKVALDKVTSVSVGGYNYDPNTEDSADGEYRRTTCATADGKAYCWGDNTYGQIGDGTTTQRTSPTPVNALDGVTSIATGWTSTCAAAQGKAYCWGDNADGQLGFSSDGQVAIPHEVTGPEGLTTVAAGFGTACAQSDSEVFCWGNNSNGQVGNGNTTDQPTPHKVSF
uniref:protein kinase domain-containing protein n=1 Tax=Gordonia sp. B7-2 TaxID=3420932 RepID=UPI003D943675